MNRLIQFKKATPLCVILLVTACFEFSPRGQAVTPAPDGGYPGLNTAEGDDALFRLTSGISNTALGSIALYNNTTGNFNTAIGDAAFYTNTTGSNNTAIGEGALANNTTADDNTATGYFALYTNSTGTQNTATGVNALYHNSTGNYNTATGLGALNLNTVGSNNTANGINVLYHNTGSNNAAYGANALITNSTGTQNTATGMNALYHNSTGNYNTANGLQALYYNTAGNYNTAVGLNALLHNTGSSNIGLGVNAGTSLTTGSGNVCIGVNVFGVAGESNTTRIRNVYSSVASGRAVYINSDNKIGTLASTRLVENDIKPMGKASEAVLALKPVSFRYKKEIDAAGTLQFGFVAEEVADVNADLVTRDSEGKPETVRYEAVNAMLLNEFLKQHKTVQQQGQTIARLEKQLETVTATLQKVSTQLELNKPATQTVLNDP